MIARISTLLLFGSLAVGCGGIGQSQAHLRTAMEAQKPTLDECYHSALERNKDTAGSMDVMLHVGEKTGKVEQVDFTTSSVNDSQLQDCVKTAIVGVTIDPKPGANLQVAYTLQFTPSPAD